jgi:aspartyl aminopeptidase
LTTRGGPGWAPLAETTRSPTADPPADLLAFVAASPSPYHAVAELARLLEDAGFTPLDERATWELAPGDRRYVVRDGGSIAAFRVGAHAPSDAGFRIVGAHTDSPAFKVRPLPDLTRAGYRLVGVEPYGGVLGHTWLDRDLTLAGRAAIREGDGRIGLRLVRLPGAPLRIPSLAIHLDRQVNHEGLKLNPQQHLVPLWGPAGKGTAPGLLEVIADHLGLARQALLGHDLVTADTQPPALGGDGAGYLFAPRLDNLASCHAGLTALLAAGGGDATQVLVCNDHEEVGSGSAEGARGPFLEQVLSRVAVAVGDDRPPALARAAAGSLLISADMAHAVHPNHAERHDPSHAPLLGGGPVLKVNANQAYATDAGSGAAFTAACADAGVRLQHFVSRADLPCGSTIGPLTATRLGIATVDVGNPLLSMHSIRELVAVADLEPMVAALRACYERVGSNIR